MEDRCVCCNEIIPEGRIVCYVCEHSDANIENNKIEMVVKVDTFNNLSDFVNLTSKCEGDVIIHTSKHIINGKSLMGLYSVDLSNPIKVEFHGDIPDEVIEGMKKFIVER